MKHADANGATDDLMAGENLRRGVPARGAGESMIYALEIKMKYEAKQGRRK